MPPRRLSWLYLAWSLLRHKHATSAMETFQARHVQISSDQEYPRELDGDLIRSSRTLTAAVRPAAVWVCVPQPSSAATKASTRHAPALTVPQT